MATIGRRAYAEIFGPTVGDRVRLADTDLLIEVEQDYTLRAGGYGEEVKFGGGKVIRDGMGQSQIPRSGGAVDTVITNALILDHSGIYKADLGLRDGLIHAIGKAGNPDTQSGVTIIIGPSTEIIAGEGKGLNKMRALVLSLAYVLGMATLAGARALGLREDAFRFSRGARAGLLGLSLDSVGDHSSASGLAEAKKGDDPAKVPCSDYTWVLKEECLNFFRKTPMMASEAKTGGAEPAAKAPTKDAAGE